MMTTSGITPTNTTLTNLPTNPQPAVGMGSETSTNDASDMRSPGENDILFGRGPNIKNHPGNQRLRALVKAQMPRYIGASAHQRKAIQLEVMQSLNRTTPPSRFLKQDDNNTSKFLEITGEKPINKVNQLFRDTEGELRKSSAQVSSTSEGTIKAKSTRTKRKGISAGLTTPQNQSKAKLLKPVPTVMASRKANSSKPTSAPANRVPTPHPEALSERPDQPITDGNIDDFNPRLWPEMEDAHTDTSTDVSATATDSTPDPLFTPANSAFTVNTDHNMFSYNENTAGRSNNTIPQSHYPLEHFTPYIYAPDNYSPGSIDDFDPGLWQAYGLYQPTEPFDTPSPAIETKTVETTEYGGKTPATSNEPVQPMPASEQAAASTTLTESTSDTGSKTKSRNWSESEDNILLNAVLSNGKNSGKNPFTQWTKLKDLLPGHSSKSIRERWVNHLNPELDRSPLTPTDHGLLKRGVEKFGKKWSQIAKVIFSGKRSENQLKNAFYSGSFKKYITENYDMATYNHLRN